MLIIGAKGFAVEVLEIFHQKDEIKELTFYDDISEDIPDILYHQFKIIKNIQEAENFLKTIDKRFVLGIGNPLIRFQLAKKMIIIGGELNSIISPFAHIGHYNTHIGNGCCIMTGVVITNNIFIGEGSLINFNCTILHGSMIGKYTEISPSVNISGNCKIGGFCRLGTGAVILPNVSIGDNVTIGAGSVVTKDIESNSVAIGVPAKIIKKLTPIQHD